MKKSWILSAAALALAVGAVYGGGSLLLRDSATRRYLDELERSSLHGAPGEYCARLHDDLAVVIHDHSNLEMPRDFEGGKRELCAFVADAAKGVDLTGVTTSATRTGYTVTRSWRHPWAAQVRYSERRVTRMPRIGYTLHTEGRDEWTLVATFDGIKALRLVSETRRAADPAP